MHAATLPSARPDAVSRAGLWLVYGFAVLSLAGYATFGRHPGLLAVFPYAGSVYGVAFVFFAQAQVWLAAAVFGAFLVRHAGVRWVPALLALYAISLASEMVGTGSGLPFGEYHYTEALGIRWAGQVPVLIPLSWFFMAVPGYALAGVVFPGRNAGRVALASLILLAWDLVLDPAMSFATAYWVWAEPGLYYGMPLLNLFGWYVTGLLLMGALVAIRADDWIDRLPLRWVAAFYGANLLLPAGMSAAAGLWGALAATATVLGGVLLVVRSRVPAPAEARP